MAHACAGKEQKYRISGHESFPFRYTWLPKAVKGLRDNPSLFSDEAYSMVALGVGKNMVRSIRFWSTVSGVTKLNVKKPGLSLTKLGQMLLGERGLDPFLEDIRTLWLLHWNLSTNIHHPLLAWDYLLNHWQEGELVPSVAIRALQREAEKQDAALSSVTIEQHFDTFIHTYIPTRGRKGEVQEDNLDCPLVELELISKVGERYIDRSSGKHEPIYEFRREEKPEITPELFVYCLIDFWQKYHPVESTITMKDVAHGHGGPGQVFKLPEDDIRARIDELGKQTHGFLKYHETASQQHIQRNGERETMEFFQDIYG
jgi:hypothetical protein